MRKVTARFIAIGAFALALAIGGGVAIAGGGLGSGSETAFLDNAAKRLGVTTEQLQAALRGAYGDQLDAAVAAGKISKEKADAMKQRASKGGLPRFGGMHKGGHHHGALGLGAAATYLGVTSDELRGELKQGKTLAAIATAKGKTVAGLKAALRAELERKIDAAVKAGKLTQTQADAKKAASAEWLDAIVNGVAKARKFGGHKPSAFVPGAATGAVA